MFRGMRHAQRGVTSQARVESLRLMALALSVVSRVSECGYRAGATAGGRKRARRTGADRAATDPEAGNRGVVLITTNGLIHRIRFTFVAC
jgi:hypothetical protein